MKILKQISICLLICLTSLFVAEPVLAFPPLPSSFYGKVKVDGENVPDGTVVEAWINGEVYAEAKTQTYQGDSVYAMDVTGDDASTNDVEGGIEDDKIEFRVAGQPAGQSGVWHSGTNTNLDLSVAPAADQVNPVATSVQATQAQPQPVPLDEISRDSASQDIATNNNRLLTIALIVAAVAIVSVVFWLLFLRKPKVKP